MKKVKTIETYYCDYCGQECEHTPNIHFPTLIGNFPCIQLTKDGDFVIQDTREIKLEQQDVCEECQRKIADWLQTFARNVKKQRY
jgi:hypothetical protein